MRPLTHVLRYLNKEHHYISKLPVLGKGAFSVVYADGPDNVIKVSMCNAYREFVNFMPETPHNAPINMPKVFDEEHLTVIPLRHAKNNSEVDLRITLYRMQRYDKFALHRVDPSSKRAVRVYKTIVRSAFNNAHADLNKFHAHIESSLNNLHGDNPHFIELMRELNNLSLATGMQFDQYKHTNFGINKDGKAVLLDPLFDCKFYRHLYM